jgi:geranylgeranyl diphosphate synthase type II
MSQADQIGFPDVVLRRFPEVWRGVPRPATANYRCPAALIDRRLNVLCPEPRGCRIRSGPRSAKPARPGKRLRPLLTMLTAMQCGSDAGLALNAACAAEMVHVASLIFDDLPLHG